LSNNGTQFPRGRGTGKRNFRSRQTDSDTYPSELETLAMADIEGDHREPPYQNRAGFTPVEETGSSTGDAVAIEGMLEILNDYGVIRQGQENGDELPKDVYISHSQIKDLV